MVTDKRWYWNRGGEPVTDTILFGRYQLIRILGQGRSGTVYLARHLELEEYRAVKQVPKSCADYQQFKKEALLLKRLRHPGIPIVYDILEDEAFSYLIEEFLEGDSFYEIIQKRGHLTQDAVVRYGIQICGLIHYLHSAEEVPILYLDLQPRNLILCHEQVKLLDFDHAGTCTEVNQEKERYGTPGFSAPEQSGQGKLGVYTDVYQIGALLTYLLTGCVEQEVIGQIAGDLGRIIRRCLRSGEQERYQSAALIEQELMGIYSKTGVSDNQSTALIISFAGARRGVGVTHLALGLCAYLNGRGYPCLYEEWNTSGDVRAMAEYLGKDMDSKGICQIFGVPVKPWYGEAVRLPQCPYPVVVRDYGCQWDDCGDRGTGGIGQARQAVIGDGQSTGIGSSPWNGLTKKNAGQAVVYVTGGKWWDQNRGLAGKCRLEKVLEEQEIRCGMSVIFNHAIPGVVRKRELRSWTEGSEQQNVCLQAPWMADPLDQEEKGRSFYEALWEQVKRSASVGQCFEGLEAGTDTVRKRRRRLLGSWAQEKQ